MSLLRFNLGAVLVGGGLAWGATFVLGLFTHAVFSVLFGVSTDSESQQLARLSASDAFHWASLLSALFATSLGGYAAGRIAGSRAIEHGFLVGVACILGGLYWMARLADPAVLVPQWSLLLGFCLAPAVGAAGGFAASDSPGAFV